MFVSKKHKRLLKNPGFVAASDSFKSRSPSRDKKILEFLTFLRTSNNPTDPSNPRPSLPTS